MERIKVVIAKPNEEAYISTIPDQIGTIEHLLGGYADEYYLQDFKELGFEDICLLCNEEGFLNGFPINRVFKQNVNIRGIMLIVKKTGNNNLLSLTEAEAITIKDYLDHSVFHKRK